MICSQCRTSYRSEPGEIATSGTFTGLCPKCGNEPRYRPFANSFGKTFLAAVISIEVLIVAALYASWWGIVSLLASALILYLLVRTAANHSEPVRYRNESEKKASTRGQRFLGFIAGVVAGIGLFWLYLTALVERA